MVETLLKTMVHWYSSVVLATTQNKSVEELRKLLSAEKNGLGENKN